MRVIKDAEVRKNEILDVAERLFCTKGFDSTSTNDILKEIGIARGTLYYHFKSKEDILDAMIERITIGVTEKAATIAGNKDIPVLERMTQTIMSLNIDNEIGHVVMEQMHRPQNALLHQKMQTSILSKVNPIITDIVNDGIAQGICHSDYPAETVEMMMIYATMAFDDLVDQTPEEEQKKVMAFIYNVERLLEMKPGSLLETMMPIFENKPE